MNWAFIREVRAHGCPRCAAPLGGRNGVQYHGLTIWCLGCGYAKNWEDIRDWASERQAASR